MLHVNVGSGQKGVNARMMGLFDRRPGSFDIPLVGTGQSADDGPGHRPYLNRNAANRLPVVFGGCRETRFHHIYAQVGDLPGQHQFLSTRQTGTR